MFLVNNLFIGSFALGLASFQ